MFIDSAKITVKGGNGGKGCRSFYRDKFTRQGIADGGDGGRGQDIIIRADRNLRTLLDFHYNRHFRGQDGGHGSGKKKKGKDAPKLYIRVPAGTVVSDALSGSILRDLRVEGDEVIIAKGGGGGRGNQHHCPATPGAPGEERELFLDLKLIADCGLVGFPNAGKSTLISRLSKAEPEIAAYPFTTKAPVLGVAGEADESFVIADIPGLIEGSSLGKGLGDRFLRHIERTRVLVHIIDMAGVDGRDPLEDYQVINKELKNYSLALARKPQIIAANKMDLASAKGNLARFKKSIKKEVCAISALRQEGLEGLIDAIRERL
jgi:GTP-binding protein